MIRRNFWNTIVSTTKIRSECRKRMDHSSAFRRAIAPADAITLRCNHSTSHVNEKRAAAMHWNSRQRENLSILATKTVHQRQHFRKFRIFKISVSWTTVAWDRITFSFRNAQSWYFEKINFKHIVAAWAGGFPEIHLFQLRKIGLKVANALIPWPDFVEQSPLLMQLLFGVTTLRVHPAVTRLTVYRRP